MSNRAFAAALIVAFVFGVAPAHARAASGADPTDAVKRAVTFGVPTAVAATWSEMTVDVPVIVRPVGIRGRIERVRFQDLAINGIPFEVDPYTAEFDLPERGPVELDAPLRLRLRYRSVAPGLLEESLLPSDTIRLTGTVRVTGTFRKWIFSAHREVAVPIEAATANPIAEYHPLRIALERYRRLEAEGWSLPF